MNIRNNTPQTVINGFDDKSVLPLVAQKEQVPQNLPLIYMQGERGFEYPTLIGGGDLTRIFGDETVNPRGIFYNHASEMATALLGEGGSVLVKRVLSGAYAKASRTLIVVVDKTAAIIQDYERDGDGNVVLDVNLDPTFTVNDTVGGAKLTFEWVDSSTYRPGGVDNFAPTGSGDIITYPILTIDAGSPGAYGNDIGIRLWHAGPNSKLPSDPEVVADQEALVFAVQLVERLAGNTAVLQEDLFGAATQEFSLKPNAFDSKTNLDLTIQRLVTNYSDDGVSTQSSPTLGPLSAVTLHDTNLDTILVDLLSVENGLAPATTTKYMLDLFTGIGYDGIHHYGFQIDAAGAKLTEGRTYYMTEGNDGDTDLASFDIAVGVEIDANYQNSAYPLVDTAQYPFSAVIDSGFSIDVKKKLMKWTGYRKEVHALIGTHVVGEDALTVSEEISVGVDLRASALLYGESDVHGTGVCRIVLVMQSGELINSSYKGRLPLTYQLAKKRARYMGAGNGNMKSGLGYDDFPLNTVSDMKNISSTWMSAVAKEAVWAAGLNFVQFSDRQTLFFPGLQTVYGIKNSVLTSEIIMQIAVDVTKMSEIVWRRLSGNTSLSKAEFKERSNSLLLELVNGRYDNRVTVVPNTYFTAADNARGYSWVLDATIYGNVMRTVGQINVITRRS